MKPFEVPHNGQVYGYVVGKNGVSDISKKGNKVIVTAETEDHGAYQTTFDLTKFPMYTIG